MVKELRGKKSCDIGLMPSILCVVSVAMQSVVLPSGQCLLNEILKTMYLHRPLVQTCLKT